MVRIDITLLCIFVPLIFGAPAEESAKQQLSPGLFRNDEGYWSMINADTEGDPRYNELFEVRTRGLDSLGQGNVLRSIGGMEGEWGNSKAPSWRIDSEPRYSSKRTGGLDSLGRGNILRRVNYDDEMYNFARSLSSLGKGNLLRSLDSLVCTERFPKARSASQSPVVVCISKLHETCEIICHCHPGGLRNGAGFRPLRRLDAPAYGLQKKFDSLSGSTFGTQKRNFDEIDRAGFGTFVKKNFDEIDRVGLGFNKRNFDEIDRTGFGSFV